MSELELTEEDKQELANQIVEGYTSGILDGEGYRISWSITTEKFKN